MAETAIDIAGHAMGRSRKFRNVAENGRAAFVIDDFVSVQPWRPRCVEIRGDVYEYKVNTRTVS